MTKWRVLEPRGYASVAGEARRVHVPRPDLARDTATACWRAVFAQHWLAQQAVRVLDDALELSKDMPEALERHGISYLRRDGWVVERMPERREEATA